MVEAQPQSAVNSSMALNDGSSRSEELPPIASPSSRFTAVNGRDSNLSTAAAAVAAAAVAITPQDGDSGTNRPSSEHKPSEERSREELWGRPSVNGDQAHNGSHAAQSTHAPPPPEAPRENSPGSAAQKRKRTDSLENNEDRAKSLKATPEANSLTAEGPSQSLSQRLPSLQTSVSPSMGTSQPYPYPPSQRPYNAEPHPQYLNNDHLPKDSPQPPEAVLQQYHSDAQIAEALQRESQSMDANNQSGERAESMEEDEDSRSSAPRNTEYGTPTNSAIDHKRRKRVFSNRTKTGCLTCRRRKKKCDETKPECNNCIRGGFVCEGYSSRVEWQKSSNAAKPPVLLQSKDGELHPVGLGDSPQHHHHTLPNGMGQGPDEDPFRQQHHQHHHAIAAPHPPKRVGPSVRVPDDEQQHRHGEPMSGGGWSKQSWPTTGASTSPYHPDQLPKADFSRAPPLHDLRTEALDASTPQSAMSRRSLLHPSHSNSPQTPQQAQAQVQAQMALQHPAAMRGRSRTEKEKMLSGELYFASDPTLVNERERCKAACWRFNNSTNPSLDVSPEERARMFRKIVQSDDIIHPQSPNGRVGEGVVVEAPLTCDYGYNIDIGEDVCIGANCTILDTCTVKIGKRCVLGPNVNIYTATLPVDPRRRKGSQGPCHGKPITIEDDCFIGGGVTILPGITIGRSSTVGAGSVVTRNVPSFTVFCGNPARVIRGIYREADDRG